MSNRKVVGESILLIKEYYTIQLQLFVVYTQGRLVKKKHKCQKTMKRKLS